jgi:hypothetical protein
MNKAAISSRLTLVSNSVTFSRKLAGSVMARLLTEEFIFLSAEGHQCLRNFCRGESSGSVPRIMGFLFSQDFDKIF